jgi:uncharacterized membrane protein SirB2
MLTIAQFLKIIHVSSVGISYGLFALRGFWRWHSSALMARRWARIAPHCVDSVLLISAIALAWQLGYTPVNSPWLAAKIVALLVYITLGMMALGIAGTRTKRLVAYLAAQLVFFYIVATAISHDPLLSL